MLPSIVYIHGIGNKPAPDRLKQQWDQALFGASLGDRSRMAYWADLRYPAPLTEDAPAGVAVGEPPALLSTEGERLTWIRPPGPEEFVESVLAEAVSRAAGEEAARTGHRDALRAWARRMTYAADALAAGDAPVPTTTEEVLPLPRPIRQAAFRALVKATLADVYAYFFGGQGDAMRERLRTALTGVDGAAVVVAHSLGTVIAYDVLRSWSGPALRVPLLVTLGSPLGVQEIEDDVVRPLQVPAPAGRWLNACDSRDIVAIDHTVGDEYPPADRVRDLIVSNDSSNHHDVDRYLAAPVVQQTVYAAVGVTETAPDRPGDGRAPAPPDTGPASSRSDPLHTPVTNGTVQDGAIEDSQVVEPDTGDVDVLEPADDGTESVARAARPETEAAPRAPAAALPDIGLASFGGAHQPQPAGSRGRGVFSAPRGPSVLETVHDGDDRVQITDTEHYPWSAVASLLITARDGSQWLGTGWFIGPRTLLTAGHCVYITNSPETGRNGWVLSIQVLPGRDGTALPFGSATATRFWTVRGWAENGDENYDYGAIVLPAPPRQSVGTFGFAVLPDADLGGQVLNVAGYPGDKPVGTLWYGARKAASVSPSKVYYDIDTMGGQSGAPVYVVDGGRRIGVAVHAYGGPTTNSGTRISPPVFENLQAWQE